MVKTKIKTNSKLKKKSKLRIKSKKPLIDPDGYYFLKIVIFLILGTVWLRIEKFPQWQLPIPIGMLAGLYFAVRERISVDRKIEYTLLLVAAFVAFWLPIGIKVSL